MGLLSRIFGSEKDDRKGPPVQEVEIHFSYGSTNFQHLYALEDEVRRTVLKSGVGEYEGHDSAADGSDGHFFLYGPDAEAIYRVIEPLLAGSTFMRGATVTLWFGPRKRKTPKRIFCLPE
ncbi:MAG: hypothetical protein ACRD4Y_03790 [Candidatus Acidiferrales bacterium]